MKFRVRGEQKPEPEVEFWLEEEPDGGISLKVNHVGGTNGTVNEILQITGDGRLWRRCHVSSNLGLRLVGFGKIELASEQ